jgi:uncharacterized protein
VKDERIDALDVLRGIAILAIFPANLPSFAFPLDLVEATHAASSAVSEAWAEGLVRALVELKAMTLLSVLFGAGIALQLAKRPLREAVPGVIARHGVLLGIGAFHAAALWFGDILFPYALCGTIALPLVAALLRQPARLAALGAAGAALPLALALAFALLGATGLLRPEDLHPDGPRTIAAALASPAAGSQGPVPGPGQEILWVRAGEQWALFGVRMYAWFNMLIACLLYYGWRVLGCMLLGAAAVGAGLLAPDARGRRLLGWTALAGLGLGLPLEAARAWLHVTHERLHPAASGLVEAVHQVASLGCSLGLFALLLGLDPRWLRRAPLRWLAAPGRVALSCYLSQTLIALGIFSWQGWFAHVTRLELLGLTAIVWTVQLALANLYLRALSQGPLEWLWRNLAASVAAGWAPPAPPPRGA